jgi:hypothetical protein
MPSQCALTLVILSIRNARLYKQLEALLGMGLGVSRSEISVLALSGSGSDPRTEFMELLDGCGDVHVEVQWIPDAGSQARGWGRRLLHATNSVSSPLVMQLADDDAVIPSGLIHAVRYLQLHPESPAVVCPYISWSRKDSPQWRVNGTITDLRFLESQSSRSRVFGGGLGALSAHTLWYQPQRTEIWKAIIVASLEVLSANRLACEAAVSQVLPLAGKIAVMRHPLYIRNRGNQPSGYTGDSDFEHFVHWIRRDSDSLVQSWSKRLEKALNLSASQHLSPVSAALIREALLDWKAHKYEYTSHKQLITQAIRNPQLMKLAVIRRLAYLVRHVPYVARSAQWLKDSFSSGHDTRLHGWVDDHLLERLLAENSLMADSAEIRRSAAHLTTHD